MKTSNIIKAFVLTGILFTTSCNDILDERNPSGLTEDIVFTTPEGFETLVNAVYGTARHWYGKEEGYTLSEGGTDLWLPGIDNRRIDLMTYKNLQGVESALGNTEVFMERIWERFYAAINQINYGLAHIDEVGLAADVAAVRKAELHFMRAFYYWHIVETWGGVHLSTTETTEVQTTANRTAVDEFYSLIFSDLAVAVAGLPPTTPDYGRATKPVAEAFLARMHLTRGNNDEALTLAKKVISDYGFQLLPKYSDLWQMSKIKNTEVIWAVNYTTNLVAGDFLNPNATALNPYGHPRGGHNGHMMFLMTYDRLAEGGGFGMTRDVANGRPFARYMPTKFLLNLFNEDIDSRYHGSFQTLWKVNTTTPAGTATDKLPTKVVNGVPYRYFLVAGDTAYYATKKEVSDEVDASKKYVIIDQSAMYNADGTFKKNSLYICLNKFLDPTRPTAAEVQSARDAFVIRLAEMYMIAAEAAFNLNQKDVAAEFINTIRTRAAVPGKTADMQITGADLSIDFILDERAREFAGEQLRWFDLKRTGKLIDRVTAHNPVAAPNIKSYHLVRPIPQREIDAVSNKADFRQNDGYQ